MRARLCRAAWLVLAVVLLCTAGSTPTYAAQAGSVTITYTWVGMGMMRYDFAWTSSAGGAVSGNVLNIHRGYIIQAEAVPGSGGTQPTNNYTLVLNDVNGVDLLSNAGAALSNTASKVFLFNPYVLWDGVTPAGSVGLDMVISNAGNAKTGTFTVLVGNVWGATT